MRAKTVQIYWHDQQPIFSIDFDPLVAERFATCGGDTFIRIWNIGQDGDINYLSTLARHSNGVNCVRWSPVASILASAGDDGSVLIWEQSHTGPVAQLGQEEDDCLEHWKLISTLRGSNQEVYDIAWSPDGALLASGGMDGCVRIFDVKTNKVLYVLADHNHFVQGIAWDPLFKYIASQSNDRTVHVYNFEKLDNGKYIQPKLIAKHSKRLSFCPDGSTLATPAGIVAPQNLESKEDNTVSSLVNTVYLFSRGRIKKAPFLHLPGHRKPAIAIRYSPIKYELIDDGTLNEDEATVEGPSIVVDEVVTDVAVEGNFISSENKENVIEAPQDQVMDIIEEIPAEPESITMNVDKPVPALFESADQEMNKDGQPDEAIRPSRKSISRKNYGESSTEDEIETPDAKGTTFAQPPALAPVTPAVNAPLRPLNYRHIFAVASLDSVTIYSTQKSHTKPIAFLSNLHYAPLTDISWSKDGRTLLLSSTDGFCTLVEFEGDELGVKFVEADVSLVDEQDALKVQPEVSASSEVIVAKQAQSDLTAVDDAVKSAAVLPTKVASTLDPSMIKKRITPTFISNITKS